MVSDLRRVGLLALPLLTSCSLLFEASSELTADARATDVTCGPSLPNTMAHFPVEGDERVGDEDQPVMHNREDGPDGTYRKEDLSSWGMPILQGSLRPECGTALRLPNSGQGRLATFASDAFPTTMSVDFWFKIGGVGNGDRPGLLIKDRPGVHANDFALFLYKPLGEDDYHLVLRLQYGNSPIDELHVCSDELSNNWHHVALSFDDGRFFVDGEVASNTSLMLGAPYFPNGSTCTQSSRGITVGETTPDWFWGMSNDTTATAIAPFRGLVDELRFRDQPFTEVEATSVYQALQP